MKQCAMLLIAGIFLTSLQEEVWATPCHVEERFKKAEGPFPSDTPLKVTTTTALALCSIECLESPKCRSVAFLTTVNTNNCYLGSTADGLATPSAAEVYKKRNYEGTIRGCSSSPCKNGGICEDLCEQPYYLCRCPANFQGDDCEWNIDQFHVDWTHAFDGEGTITCSGNSFLAGLERSDCGGINCIEGGKCGPLSIEYKDSSLTCQNARWWDSFATNSWSNCPDGYLLRGFWRNSGSNDLGYIEEGVCCRPAGFPVKPMSCYFEDISHVFDAHWATAKCQRPLHYIHGIRTAECTDINCMEEFHCCKLPLPQNITPASVSPEGWNMGSFGIPNPLAPGNLTWSGKGSNKSNALDLVSPD